MYIVYNLKYCFLFKPQLRLTDTFKFAFIKLINHLFTIVLDDLPLLYEAPEGSQPSSRADHDDRAAGAERKAETGVTDKDGNTNIRNTCKTRRKSSLKGGLVSLIKIVIGKFNSEFLRARIPQQTNRTAQPKRHAFVA